MNERLTEIYRSCRPKEALASQDQFNSANVLLGSEVEKFAELIIKECIKVVDDTITENQEMNIGLVFASAAIVAHFGVEE